MAKKKVSRTVQLVHAMCAGMTVAYSGTGAHGAYGHNKRTRRDNRQEARRASRGDW